VRGKLIFLWGNKTFGELKNLWRAYIHPTNAEDAFKVHKTDLHLRPLWHQKDAKIRTITRQDKLFAMFTLQEENKGAPGK
jgi:hypothetical protein